MSFKNFLLAHYEKLILVGLLVVFGILLYFQFSIVQKGRMDEVDRLISQKEPESDYQVIKQDANEFKTQLIFSDPLMIASKDSNDNSDYFEMMINFKAPAANSTAAEMMSPYAMAECIHCHALIPAFNFPAIGAKKSGKCPVCNKEIKPKEEGDEALVDNDTNGNNIPDEWETKFKVTSDYSSAEYDEDEDGFTLYEEYKANTDPKDSQKHPLYVSRLYVYQVSKQEIPYLQLKSVTTSGTDKAKWYVAFTIRKKNAKRLSSASVRLNDGTFENNGVSYKVIDIVEDEASSNPIVYIQPIGTDQKIECKVKQPVLQPNLRVVLDELVHNKRVTSAVGEVVRLGTVKTGQEAYRILSADPDTKTAVLQSTADDGKQYAIPAKPADAAKNTRQGLKQPERGR